MKRLRKFMNWYKRVVWRPLVDWFEDHFGIVWIFVIIFYVVAVVAVNANP